MAVDDATRLSYVEVLPDEKGPTTVGFQSRAVAWFNGQGIGCRWVLSENGSDYKSHGWRNACQALGWKAKKTIPYTPRTNGKAERFINTLLEEWACVMPYGTSAARNALFLTHLRIDNGRRCPMALSGLTPPMSHSLSGWHEQPGGKAHVDPLQHRRSDVSQESLGVPHSRQKGCPACRQGIDAGQSALEMAKLLLDASPDFVDPVALILGGTRS